MWETNRGLLQERVINEITGKEKIVSVKIKNGNKKQAINDLMKKINAIPTVENLSLEKAIEMYLTEKELTIKESTLKMYRVSYVAIINVLGADTPVNKLTARYIQASFFKEFSKKGATYINNKYKYLKLFLTWCYQKDLIESDSIIKKISNLPDKEKLDRIEDKYLEREELKQLLEGMNHDVYKNLTEFLALSGLRIGEAIALTWDDIDNKYIHVTKTYENITSTIDTPKTRSSYRDVFIQPELKECINRIKKLNNYYSHSMGFISNYVFIQKCSGSMINYISYCKYLERNSEIIINHKITPHALRHTHVSLLAESGLSLDLISRRLGHESEGITKKVYLHITEKNKERENKMLEKVALLD